MKLLSILNFKAVGYAFLYLNLVFWTFQVAYGSYGEAEPTAGNILLVAGIIFSAIGIFLQMKFKPNYILWEKA